MVVSFLSFDDQQNKTAFQAEATQKGNEILFEDKSCQNTQIKLILLKDSFILERFGEVQMKLQFTLDKQTKGVYKNKEGLEFAYSIETKELLLSSNKIKTTYIMKVEDQPLIQNTFQVTFFQK